MLEIIFQKYYNYLDKAVTMNPMFLPSSNIVIEKTASFLVNMILCFPLCYFRAEVKLVPCVYNRKLRKYKKVTTILLALRGNKLLCVLCN